MTEIIAHDPLPHESTLRLQAVLVRLLQGIIFYEDKKLWQQLLHYENQVRRYFLCLGMHLHLSQDDGYAFLKSQRIEEDHDPHSDSAGLESGGRNSDGRSLIRRIPLSYDVSLLCVLLREALEHFDTSTQDDHRLIVKTTDIYEMLRTFYPETNDLAKQQRRFDAIIGKVEDLLFLKKLEGGNSAYEVRRVIKALIDADCIDRIKQALKNGQMSGKNNEDLQ